MKRLTLLCVCLVLFAGCATEKPKEVAKADKDKITEKINKDIAKLENKKESDSLETNSKNQNEKNEDDENKDEIKKDTSKSQTNTQKTETSTSNPSKEESPKEQTPSTPPQQTEKPQEPVQPEQPTTPQYTEASYAEEVRSLINSIRVNNGLPALYSNALLTNITQQRASHQLQSYGHVLPNGMGSGQWAEQQGIIPGGENVAMMSQGFTPSAVVNDWMASPGHQAPILSDYTSYMDVAVRFANGRVYVVACWQQ